MIYFLTGEDVVASRNKLSRIINRDSSVTRLDGVKNSLSEILDAYESNSLFTEKRTIIVENFTKVKIGEKMLAGAARFQNDPDTTVIFWDEADYNSKSARSLEKAVFESFVFPKLFYKFIDGFSPKNKKGSALLFRSLLASFAPEQVLFSLVKRTRLLCVVKDGLIREFSEGQKLADWQVDKLVNQASLWSKEELENFLLKLAETEEQLKSGGLPTSLSEHLDMLLLSDLN